MPNSPSAFQGSLSLTCIPLRDLPSLKSRDARGLGSSVPRILSLVIDFIKLGVALLVSVALPLPGCVTLGKFLNLSEPVSTIRQG